MSDEPTDAYNIKDAATRSKTEAPTDKLFHLRLHPLQLLPRLVLCPLPLRRVLDQLVLRRVRGDRGLGRQLSLSRLR
jgi:hypothetical protein